MTNREAIAAEIEPYSLSEDSVEKSYMDAAARFGIIGYVDDEYDYTDPRAVALASMFCLDRVRCLSSENIGGISQSFSAAEIEKRIRAIALRAGISPSIVLSNDSGSTVTYMGNMW